MKLTHVHVVGNDRSVIKMFEQAGVENVGLKDLPATYALLCFTGGEDLNPKLYGEENTASSFNDIRDEYEVEVYNAFNGILPMVGICRGGQLINVMNGGKMIQDIKPMHSGIRRLTGPYGSRRDVLEDHHQVMVPAPGCPALWRDEKDNTAEVVHFYKKKQLAFQAHPEWGHKPTEEFFFHLIAEYM